MSKWDSNLTHQFRTSEFYRLKITCVEITYVYLLPVAGMKLRFISNSGFLIEARFAAQNLLMLDSNERKDARIHLA